MTDEELGLDFTEAEWELWCLEAEWRKYLRALNLAFRWRNYKMEEFAGWLRQWHHIRRSVNSTEVAARTKHLKVSPYDQWRGHKAATERPSVMKLVDMLEKKLKQAERRAKKHG